MATYTTFAYNNGASPGGTTQIGTIAIGTPTDGFAATGLSWRKGPDEDLGYVIAYTASPPRTAGNGTVAISVNDIAYKRSETKTLNSFITLANAVANGATGDFASANAAKTWLNTNGYWTSYTNDVTFSRPFVQGSASGATTETAWNTFRAALTGSYTQFVISNSLGFSLTVSHATSVQTLATALKNGTQLTYPGVTIGNVVWYVGLGCGTPSIGGVAVELSNVNFCSASSTIALRPMIGNLNWGGMGTGSTVNQASQTITLTFS